MSEKFEMHEFNMHFIFLSRGQKLSPCCIAAHKRTINNYDAGEKLG